MDFDLMRALVQRHLQAWAEGDAEGALALCTGELVQEVVGWPAANAQGRQAARVLCRALACDFRETGSVPAQWQYLPNALMLDRELTGPLRGPVLGLSGGPHWLTLRVLHVFEFRDRLIHRETVWLDGAAIERQLGAKSAPRPAGETSAAGH